MAVSGKYSHAYCVVQALIRIFMMLVFGTVIKLASCISQSCAEKVLYAIYKSSKLGEFKYRFNIRHFWTRPYQLTGVIWNMWLSEARRSVQPGLPAPDPRLVELGPGGEPGSEMRLQQVCHENRPLLLVFGSST